MHYVHVKLHPGVSWEKQLSIRRNFDLTCGAYFCMLLKLGQSESRSEIPGKFLNVVLEKDGEN